MRSKRTCSPQNHFSNPLVVDLYRYALEHLDAKGDIPQKSVALSEVATLVEAASVLTGYTPNQQEILLDSLCAVSAFGLTAWKPTQPARMRHAFAEAYRASLSLAQGILEDWLEEHDPEVDDYGSDDDEE